MNNQLKIKELRTKKNLTQDEVVSLSGIPKRSYNNYESGITDIPGSKLQDIARVLKCSIDELLGFNAPKKEEKEETLDEIIFSRMFDKFKPYIDNEIKDRLETIQESVMMLLKQVAQKDVKKD